ncbi:MAG: acyl-CoA reductase, partial [Chthoniobacterales bacterium]
DVAMNIFDRAKAITKAAEPFRALLGPTSADDLLSWLRAELGSSEALDRWVDYGKAKTKAIAPETILHVVSGNTPHAALQSLVGGLLLGSRNLVKLPRGGIIEVDEFVSGLSEALRAKVETAEELPSDWLAQAEAVIVYGSDETMAHFRGLVAPSQVFVGHGHRASLGIVWDDPQLASCDGAARAASLFDQQGCLSPQVFYVREARPGFAREYAEKLSSAMDHFNRSHPRGPLTVEEKAAISNLRAAYRFRAANDLRVALWEGGGNMDWTVVYEEDFWFPASPLNRVIFVKPLPENFVTAIGPAAAHIGAVGLFPCNEELANRFAELRPSRFCPIGRMQDPPWTWHNGGIPRLASLVKWVDFES